MRILSIIIFCFIVLGFSCKTTQEIESTISFDSNNLNDKCGSGFKIAKKREVNDFFRKELEKYLYKAFIDNEICEDISKDIFDRESFKEMVLEVYLDSNFLNFSIYDYESRWRESYINLLNYCMSEDVFYALCDSLLLQNIDDGLIAVWDKDAKKLHYLKRYAKKNKNDYYQMAQLISVYHNSNMEQEEEQAIIQLKKLDIKEAKSFLNLLIKGEKVDYFDFMEVVYGGM